jgi:hypothetical protein
MDIRNVAVFTCIEKLLFTFLGLFQPVFMYIINAKIHPAVVQII